MLYALSICRVIPVEKAMSLGVVVVASEVDDADWTTELGTGNEDTGLSFNRRDLYPKPLAKRILVSNKLLRVSTLNPEDLSAIP